MCVLFGFTDSELAWAGGAYDRDSAMIDGAAHSTAPCAVFAL
jgi:hypothetical protein